ncbi:MAG: hypothetical protein U1E36_05055 [Rickettsiales bacterium]
MKRSVFQHITVFLISFCFLTGALGFTYSDCPMAAPEQQNVLDAINCHEQGLPKPGPEKKCCIDLSCPKCFSTPYAVKWKASTAAMAERGYIPTPLYSLFFLAPATPERPPKLA